MPTIELDLPESAFSALRRSPHEFAREMRIAAAIHWCSRAEVSQERAAEIAGLTRIEFLLALAQSQTDAIVVDIEDLKRELARD